MFTDLIYDKFSGSKTGNTGDHSYTNPVTSSILVNDLEDGTYGVYINKDAIELYNKKFKNHFQIPEFIIDSELFKLKLYTKEISNINIIIIIISVNYTLLEKHVDSKKNSDIPLISSQELSFLEKTCRYHLAYTETVKFVTNTYYYNNDTVNDKIKKNTKYIIDSAIKAVDYTFDNKITNPVELNLELFDYQKCSVYWMIQKEKNKGCISYNLNEEVILGNVYYDLSIHSFDLLKNKKTLRFKGGAIIDEVGRGKSLQIISLALCNPADKKDYTNDLIKNKFISKATIIFCPNHLCGQWLREFKDKVKQEHKIKIVTLMTKRDHDKLRYVDLLDADFVIVSYTFLDNKVFTTPWASQLNNQKNFYKQKWKNTDWQAVNNKFNEMGEELLKDKENSLQKTNPMIQLINWHRVVVDEFHEIYKDESTYTYISNLLPFINGTNKWAVTATPFNKSECLYKIVDFITDYQNTDGDKILTVEQVVDYLISNSFRRNTNDSTKEEHILPPIEEEVRLLKFSHTERMMYNAYLADPNNDKFGKYLRQLCCHPLLAEETKEALSNCKTLEDIEKTMVNFHKIQMSDAKEKVDKIQERLSKLNKKIKKIEKKQFKKEMKKKGIKIEDSDSDSDKDDGDAFELLLGEDDLLPDTISKPSLILEKLKETVKEVEEKLKDATKIYEGKEASFNFYNNMLEKIKKTVLKESNKGSKFNNISGDNIMDMFNDDDLEEDNDDETCGICLGEIPENDIGVTQCGHIFCFECLNLSIKKNHLCPYCRKKLNDNEIYVLSYEKQKKNNITQKEKDKFELINEIGTKLANLITYIRETGEHMIIFSQWDDLLIRVGRVLKENNVPNVFCKGNCYQRDKAIREFNEDDKIKIIMLSSESAAAGTNLTKASRVVFIDPIYGDYKFRKDQEKQAIGRAHRLGQKSIIKVVRFIIKESVEEEIYKLNKEQDKLYKNEFLNTHEISVI